MNYIYDILLNFNDNYFDFYDWNKLDNITEIRKIPIFKINSEDMYKIKNNYVIFDNEFKIKLKNKTEYFVGRSIKLMSAFLLTDGIDVIGIKLGNNVLYSSLQIDEELDILEELNINTTHIKYDIIKDKKIDAFKTRYQIEQEKVIKDKIKDILKENNIPKIKYIYYECFNKKENDIEVIKNNLKSVSNECLKKLDNILNSSKIV